MKQTIEKEAKIFEILEKIIFFFYSLLFFLTPLILTPWTSELFEFNKMVFVYLITTIIVFLWLLKIIIGKKITVEKTFWDLPLLLFLISQIASTITSIDRHTSVFGYYSRFNGGLLSTICYLLLYWGLVSNLKSQNLNLKIVKIILISGFFVSLYGIAEHFGIDKNIWVQDVQNRVFSTLGQPNWLAAYLDILIFITLSSIIFSNSKKTVMACYLLFTVYYICLLFTKSRSGFLGFLIPLIFFFGTNFLYFFKNRSKEIIKKNAFIIFIIIIASIFVGTPFSGNINEITSKINFSFLSDVNPPLETNSKENAPPQTENGMLITPSSDIRKIVWKGAIDLWKKFPVFGTGVETFAYSYYWTRPIEHNLTSEWDFLYNKAHNEYLNLAANSGIFGLGTHLIIILSLFLFIFKNLKQSPNPLFYATFYSTLSLSITNFFGFSVVPVSLLFFLLPAIALTNNFSFQDCQKNISFFLFPISKKQKIALLLATIFFLIIISKIINYWRGDFYYVKGVKLEKTNNLIPAIESLNKAIAFNSNEPNYYSERSIIFARLTAAVKENELENEENIGLLAKKAINDSEKAINLSPFNLNLYKNRAQTFYYLSFYQPEFIRESLASLLVAEKMAPTDPKIIYNIGLIYQALNDAPRAKQYFEKALNLKPNYQEAAEALKNFKN